MGAPATFAGGCPQLATGQGLLHFSSPLLVTAEAYVKAEEARVAAAIKVRSLNPQPSTLNPHSYSPRPQPSTLIPILLTLNPQPSTLNPQPSALNPKPPTLNPQPSNLKLETL